MTERLLNVGGSDHDHYVPPTYEGWDNIILDLTPDADIKLNACDLYTLAPHQFDAIFCSHMLEHVERWELHRVISGFDHVLKPDGWLDLRVPDLEKVALKLVETKDPEAQLYVSPAGPITIADILYGYPLDIQDSELMRHRNGFTFSSMKRALRPWFKWAAVAHNEAAYEMMLLVYRTKPDKLPEGLTQGG